MDKTLQALVKLREHFNEEKWAVVYFFTDLIFNIYIKCVSFCLAKLLFQNVVFISQVKQEKKGREERKGG